MDHFDFLVSSAKGFRPFYPWCLGAFVVNMMTCDYLFLRALVVKDFFLAIYR